MTAEIPVIRPTAVFTLPQLQEALSLRGGCLPREIRLGRLRSAKRAGKVLVLGKWVLEWIAAGERVKERGTAETT